MIMLQWYQIDWVIWLPVILLILLGVILLLRILRRLTRWGSVNTTNIKCFVKTFEGGKYAKYILQFDCCEEISSTEPASTKNNLSNSSKNVLIIPPLGVKGEKNYHLAMALAINKWDVLVLSPRLALNWVENKPTSTKLKSNLTRYIKSNHISHIILFDYAMCPILNEIQKEISNLQIDRLICIRPTLNWSHIRPFWHFLPFSERWWAVLKLKIHYSKYRKINDLRDCAVKLLEKEITSVISPNKSWNTDTGIKIIEKINIADLYEFQSGGWSFYRQETILFALILQKLNKNIEL
jgi:hypothetical protein